MTDKDPKDMTVSEQLRWAANGEPYNGIDENIWTYPTGKIRALAEAVTGEWPSDNEIFSIVADKIDAELVEARNKGISLSLSQGAKLWAKANGWPDFREGEDFGAWLDRCALKLPCDKDGEPWSIGDRVMPGNRSESTVTGYDFDGNEWFLKYRWCGIDSYANEFATSCKRPAPEVLGADGLPLKVGEVVYSDLYGYEKSPIVSVHRAGECLADGTPASFDFVRYEDGFDWAFSLTHTTPDTHDRVDEDKKKTFRDYWDCWGVTCRECPADIDGKAPMVHYGVRNCYIAQGMDIARRQAELDKLTGGAE